MQEAHASLEPQNSTQSPRSISGHPADLDSQMLLQSAAWALTACCVYYHTCPEGQAVLALHEAALLLSSLPHPENPNASAMSIAF